jgi:D-alanyl-D-alanine carboxypeptidase/D-alanyl-D-alanine carboxypeptidase (penicillin-binding protein 5/6)
VDKYIKLSRYQVAPIKEGDILGEIVFTVDGKEIGRQSLVATESISAKSSKGLFDRLISLFD